MTDLFYMQDSRSYDGNDILFWAKDGRGYTTDVSKAHVFTREEAIKQHESRIEDIPLLKDYVDARVRPTVDMQNVDRKEALKGTGIVLCKPEKPKKEKINCHQCGRFITEYQKYSECSNCGVENGH